MNNYYMMEQLVKDRQREMQQTAALQRQLRGHRRGHDHPLGVLFRRLAKQWRAVTQRTAAEKYGCNSRQQTNEPIGATAGC